MRRSEMIKYLQEYVLINIKSDIDDPVNVENSKIDAENILKCIESFGMQPPKVRVGDLVGEDHPWGGGCSIRCNCESCNPNFLVNRWENE